MKRFLTVLCALVFTASISAYIRYDENNNTFYSSPTHALSSGSFYRDRYNLLCFQLWMFIAQYRKNNMSEEKIHEQLVSYLETLGTPTACQLLADIEAGGFFSYILKLGLEILTPTWFQDSREGFSKNPDIKAKDIDECMLIYWQMSIMVKTCWNSGVYGEDVYDQIVDHLEALNTPAAKYFLSRVKKDHN